MEEASPDDRRHGSTLALQDETNELMIWIWRLRDGENRAVCNHFVFPADGKVDEVHEKMVAAGTECKPPFTAGWGGRKPVLHDLKAMCCRFCRMEVCVR